MQLQIDKFSFGYHKQNLIFQNLSQSFQFNHNVILTGENGGGKSSFFRLLLGLEMPFSGEMTLISPEGTKYSLPEIGYVCQNSLVNSFVPITVKEVILSGGGFKGQLNQEIFHSIVGLTKIEPLLSRRFHVLSGGEKQKTLLARALIKQPKVLFLDEIFSNVDYFSKIELKQILEDYTKENHRYLLVTHDLQLFGKHRGEFLFLTEGKFLKFDSFDSFEKSLFHQNPKTGSP